MFTTELIASRKPRGFSKIAAGMIALAAPAFGFGQAVPRISGPISDSALTTLHGSVHPLARAEFDRGPVEDSHVGRMLLVLKRSPEQQANLQQLIDDQQNAASPNFHKWLTAEQFGKQFGVADADVQTVTSYLQDKGFSVGRIYKNRGAIEVSGTAGQLRATFHTQIHRYSIQGKEFFANANEPRIPTALTSVVSGFASLNNIKTGSTSAASAESIPVSLDPETKKIAPAYTATLSGATVYLLAPADIQSIYDIPVLTTSPGAGGTGVTVGVIGDSQINLDLIARYQNLTGAGKTTPTEIVDGNDPGILGVTATTPDATIAYQQIELIGAAAPYANINYYVSADTDYDTGLNFAIIRAVDDNAAQVLSLGFQTCEGSLGVVNNALVNNSWMQAAAQGMTVVVAAGDTGSAGCDLPGTGVSASSGLGVNGYASSPYNVAVGGTDFYYTAALPATHYWSATTGGSVTKANLPIPEQAWNDSIQTTDVTKTNPILNAGGGGLSLLGKVDLDNGTQSAYLVPSWQVNAQKVAGIASPVVRAIPDVSFFAGNNYNSSEYVICASPADCASPFAPTNATVTGGTAGAAAVFAGIMADVVAKNGMQGNVNPILYGLSGSIYSGTNKTGVYHDVKTGNNSVSCAAASPNCSGGTIKTGATNSYLAGTGYDLATGLGSVDALNLINAWAVPATKTTTTSLSIVNATTQAAATSVVHGTILSLTAKVTGTGGVPTGDVAFTTNSTLPSYGGISASTLSGGSAYSPYNYFLPGGSYTVSARYAGDGTFLPSVGTTPITVTPEPSRTFIYSSTYPSGSTVTYGTTNNVTAEPFSLNNNNVSTPTGTLSVFNGGLDPVTVMSLNSEGTATYNTNLLTAGNTYQITFNYSGDPSYLLSNTSATPYTITVTKAPTNITLANSGTLSGNSPVGLTALVSSPALNTTPASTSTGVPPTGTVTFTNGAGTQTVVNVNTGFDANGKAISTATLPVSITQTQTQVSLRSAANVTAYYNDGSLLTLNNGLDGNGYAYSANQLGTTITSAGVKYNFGNANQNDAVSGTNGPTINLPNGNYTNLEFLGTAVNGNQTGQTFTVKYTDGSTQLFTQSMSDWVASQGYTGETVAKNMPYRDTILGGQQNTPFNIYAYNFSINSSKTVASITLPNNSNISVEALTLVNLGYTAVYSGDANYAASSTTGSITANSANYTGTSGVSISLNNTTVNANGSLIVTATATQSTGTPTGTVQVFANGVSIGSFAISSGTATPWTVPLTNGYLPLPSGTVTLSTVFTPLNTALSPSSASTTVTVTDNRTSGDFAITTDTRSQTITSSSNNAYFQVQLSAIQNMAGLNTPITLTCSVPASSNLGCTLQGSATLDATGSVVVPLQIYGRPTGGTGALQMPAPAQHWWLIGGGSTLACIFLLGIPARRRTWQGLMSFFVCAVVITGSITGCGTNRLATGQTNAGTAGTQGGNGGGGSLTPGYTNGLATNTVNPGTYTVVITGTSTTNTTLTHNTAVSVVVNTGQSFANGSYSMTSVHTGMLITDPSAATASGTGLVQMNADGASDQKWIFNYQNNGYFTITNAANGLFITDPGGNTGVVQVTQSSMIGTVAAPDGTQLWTLYANEGGYEIVNAQSGGVLDDNGQNTAQGTAVICYPQKPIIDSGNQTWYIQSAP